ncbi:DUF302 domain-containing protein [Aurantimonas sp. A2-1-M11]|uniref:DUF302 domain-containing protein n=1 Tax=Aurantimonas sp. A2-1-M11 TaxID=3113712 RepID=UPI002F94C3A4
MIRQVLHAATLVGAILLSGVTAQAMEGMNIRSASGSVEETVARLTAAIENAGAKVVAVVDHAANARSVDADIPETRVIIFGNPKLGTPLIQENALVAIDLPQKMLVWRDGETTKVGYLEPDVLATRYGLDPASEPVTSMTTAMDRLAGMAASTD